MLNDAVLAQAAPAQLPLAPTVLPIALAKKGIGPDIALEQNEKEQDKEPQNGEEQTVAKISQFRRRFWCLKWQE